MYNILVDDSFNFELGVAVSCFLSPKRKPTRFRFFSKKRKPNFTFPFLETETDFCPFPFLFRFRNGSVIAKNVTIVCYLRLALFFLKRFLENYLGSLK